MSITRRRFITISAGLALGGVSGPAKAKPTTWRGVVLGADAQLVLTGLPPQRSQKLIEIALSEIERLERIFSLYKPSSVLFRLNRNGHFNAPPADLLAVLGLATSIFSSTGGYFDPTIQQLWKTYAEHQGLPPAKAIMDGKLSVGMDKVGFDGRSIRYKQSGMAMTLNGIAQGYVTDRIVELLASHGLRNAVVKMGEIAAIGQDQNNQPWQIGIAEQANLDAEEFVYLSDQCIATSAPHATTFDGLTSHIINPFNGQPARSLWRRISVIHKSACLADGLSTAFVLMDADQIRVVSQKYPDVQILAEPEIGDAIRISS